MKLIFSCVFLLLVVGRVLAADPVIEFRGVMAGDGPTKLSLVDKSNDITRWVEVGQNFTGFKVKGYDAAKETATLTKDGQEYQIRLNTSRIVEADHAVVAATKARRGMITPELLNQLNKNFRQISAAADQYIRETGKTSVRLRDLVGPDKSIKELTPVRGETYAASVMTDGRLVVSAKLLDELNIMFDPRADSEMARMTPDPIALEPVHASDTGATIAKRSGITPARLQELNPGVDFTKLTIGQTLRVH